MASLHTFYRVTFGDDSAWYTWDWITEVMAPMWNRQGVSWSVDLKSATRSKVA